MMAGAAAVQVSFGGHVNVSGPQYALHNHTRDAQAWTSPVPPTADNSTAAGLPAADPAAVVAVSLLFCIVGAVGLVGNVLIMYVIVADRKMRRSVTNIFILNLAAADFLIMALGVPEIIQFMLNRGWLLGGGLCKAMRYLLVLSLYVSVLTLMGVCVERYIAIVHPIRAHLLCSRRRILAAVLVIWPAAVALALPTALYNTVARPSADFPVELCMLAMHGRMAYKLAECIMFFLVPVVVQVALYSVISRHLFLGTESLHRKQAVVNQRGGHQRERDSDAIKARKGVVKMLIATVTVYFLSYAPVQVPLFWNMLTSTPFKQNWSFLVLCMTLAQVNSAANPILYSIFSRNFRLKFAHALCRCCRRRRREELNGYRPATSMVAMDSYHHKLAATTVTGYTRGGGGGAAAARFTTSVTNHTTKFDG